jgi:glucose/arabinose dehydrogenase
MRPRSALALSLAVAACACDADSPASADFRVTIVADGLSHPWGMAFLPDGRILVSEREGRLRIAAADGTLGAPVAGLPAVDARGQGGLLDVALHPQFAANRLVYLSYAEADATGANSTAVARARLAEDGLALTGLTVVFSQKPKIDSTLHFGSRLVFDRNGLLYVTLGERSHGRFRVQAQDLGSHLGKVVRIRDDGAVPDGNPFVGRAGALPEIWSYGHRNVQGAALHPETGALWTIEHGPRGGDELNIPAPGRNYGWPVISHGVNYDGTPVGSGQSEMPGMEAPIRTWTPVIAPGGMAFYTGELFPEWKGDLLIAGLRSQALIRLDLDGSRVVGEERLLTERGRRIRDVEVGPDGAVYVLTDEDDGAIWRIAPRSKTGG